MLTVKLSNKIPSGNVLLLSLLILAGGIAGALAIGVVVISELKQSSAADQGLAAFFDAESGLEQSMYNIRQANLCDNIHNCDDADYVSCPLPQFSTSANCVGSVPGCLQANCQKNIKPASRMEVNLEPNDTFQIDLDPSVDTAVKGFRFSNWSHDPNVVLQAAAPLLEISYVVIGSDNVTSIYRPQVGKPYECLITDGTQNCTNATINNTGGDYPLTGSTVYQVRVKALRSRILNLQISALDDGGNPVELSNYLDVKSKGEKSGVQQVLRTTVPKNLPVYGFPDYVVFSEETIVK